VTTSRYTDIDQRQRRFDRSVESVLEIAPGILAPFSSGAAHADIFLHHGAHSTIRRVIQRRDLPSTARIDSSTSGLALNVVCGKDAFHEWMDVEDARGLEMASAAARTMIREEGEPPSAEIMQSASTGWDCPDATAIALLQACTDALSIVPAWKSLELILDRRFSEHVVLPMTGRGDRSVTASNRIIAAVRGRSGDKSWRIRRVWELQPDQDIDAKAASIAAEMTSRCGHAEEARSFAASRTKIVFTGPLSTAWMHEAIGHLLEADAFFAGPFSDLMGKQIGPASLSIIDAGERMDHEGTPGTSLQLISEGRIENVMADQRRTHRYGIRPTANGFREDARSVPLPRMRQPTLQPGEASLAELLAEINDGLLIDTVTSGQLLADGTVALYGASGYRVEDGVRQEPLGGMTLTATALDIIRGIRHIGGDVPSKAVQCLCVKSGQALPIAVSSPSVLIDGFAVA
jgi:predicted Zn-dependent protease